MVNKFQMLLLSTTLGAGLASAPLAVDLDAGTFGTAAAAAKGGGNGGGNAGGNGGNGGGHGGGNGGGKSGGKGGGTAGGNGGGHGSSGHASASAGSAKSAHGTGASSGGTDIHPGDLGRLNGFLHASPQARLSAAPGSAVGLISHGYAEALQAYLDSGDVFGDDEKNTPEEGEEAAEAPGEEIDTPVTRDAALLAEAAAILAAAANKPLSPEIVARINGELGIEDLSEAEVEAIADAAETQ